MKKIFLLNLIFSLFVGSLCAQEFIPYSWEKKRAQYELSSQELEYPLYYILRLEDYQYIYEDESLVCYETFHFIMRVNNDDAVKKTNRIYIPMRNAYELTSLNARVIKSNGKIIDFDINNLKELENEEAGYKIFAIEGAETGSEIEYFYTKKTYAGSFKSRKQQFEHPVREAQITVSCPENLEYDFKVYNSDVVSEKIDDSEEFNQYRLKFNNIPALYEEDFAALESSKIRVEYKLAYNSNMGKRRLNTWGMAGQRIYRNIYDLTSDEEKALTKFVKSLDKKDTPLETFRNAEHYIKTNFFFEENAGDQGSDIAAIIQNKYATSRGFTKLYAGILRQLELEHEIVLAADKFNRIFDPSFDTWNFLEEYFIYVNSADQFLSPRQTAFRLGTIEHEYIGTEALFIRTEDVQDYDFAVAYISTIPVQSHEVNYDNLDLKVSFDEDLEENLVDVTRTYGGYSNQYYKRAMIMAQEDRKEEILEDIVKYLAEDGEIDEVTVLDKDYSVENWNTPFKVQSNFKTKLYIEKAGNIVLFKAGELIGPQSELYQENERILDVVNYYNRGYLRTISVEIPEGYKIKNPDDLIIDEVIQNEAGQDIFKFTSSYEINGSTLDIKIIEFYDQITYPAERFEEFRKVINAAADWNKIVLVLEN